MELPAEPGLLLTVCTAPAGTATADGPALLASWAAMDAVPTGSRIDRADQPAPAGAHCRP
nr:hypothetical protein [Saccharothrix obliqua]